MRTTLNLIITAIIINIVGCNNQQNRNVPADAQMIEHFTLHEKDFKKLCLMIEKDSLDHYPLFAQEEGEVLPISANRQLKYDSLMKILQIESLWYSNPYQNTDNKSILLFYFGKGDATWGIDKGFEYVPERTNEEGKEFIEDESYDVAMEKNENCFLYKKINDNWNLFLMYDR